MPQLHCLRSTSTRCWHRRLELIAMCRTDSIARIVLLDKRSPTKFPCSTQKVLSAMSDCREVQRKWSDLTILRKIEFPAQRSRGNTDRPKCFLLNFIRNSVSVNLLNPEVVTFRPSLLKRSYSLGRCPGVRGRTRFDRSHSNSRENGHAREGGMAFGELGPVSVADR